MTLLALPVRSRWLPSRVLVAALVAFAGAPALVATTPAAHAEDEDTPEDDTQPIVRAIDIQGLGRVDRGSVRDKIYTQIGRALDRSRLSEDIKRIYAMAFFDDVQVTAKPHPDGGIVLVFKLTERPTVTAIDYEVDGTAVSKDDIKGVVDIHALDILDEAHIRTNITKIQDLYVEQGHFLAETTYKLTPEGPSGVRLTFIVREGEKVEVRRIDIVGNKALTSEEIEANLFTREGGWFSFLSKSGEFKKEMFETDVQRIQYLYLTKGYVQIQVGEPIVTLASDRRSMEIVIPVEEGPRYKVGDIDIQMADDDAKWLIEKDALRQRVSLQKGEWFDYGQMQQDVQAVSGAFKDKGYANASVATEHHVDPDTLTFGVTYRIQKGEPVHIRRIEIRGNTDTRDRVIRREMKIAEGDLYSIEKIKRSHRRIMALGFFEPATRPGDDGGVKIEPRPTGDPRTVDLVVSVKEKQTGTFQIGAGFSSLESFILTGQISKENFLGRGQTLSAQITFSAIRQLYSVSFFEPYFFDSQVTFAFDLFNFQEEFVDFTRLRTGGTLSLGYRITDDLSLSLSYDLESVNATLRRTDIDIERLRQEGLTSSMRATLSLDTRDNRIFPTSGSYSTLSFEIASKYLGSENQFWRIIGRTRWYFPLFWDFVLRLNGTAGIIEGLDGQSVPLFERFFVGGIFTVRGFERNSIGEHLYLSSNPDGTLNPITIGGNKELILNAEIEFPIFKEVGIKGVVFFDAGNSWGDGNFNPLDLRTSAGFGIRWNSPVGPLRFEWGFPLKPRKGEDPSVFEFTIGNSF